MRKCEVSKDSQRGSLGRDMPGAFCTLGSRTEFGRWDQRLEVAVGVLRICFQQSAVSDCTALGPGTSLRRRRGRMPRQDVQNLSRLRTMYKDVSL